MGSRPKGIGARIEDAVHLPHLRNICVYCGSRVGERPAYLVSARALAAEFSARDIGLVYGGASVGLMVAVADELLLRGGRAIGVIPRALVDREIAHGGLTELVVVETMHERKAEMIRRSDGFIAMPGGLGTLEELFEVLTWAQIGLHRKPIGLLNVDGYYDGLLGFLHHSVREGFIPKDFERLFFSDEDPKALLNAMDTFQSVAIDIAWTKPPK